MFDAMMSAPDVDATEHSCALPAPVQYTGEQLPRSCLSPQSLCRPAPDSRLGSQQDWRTDNTS